MWIDATVAGGLLYDKKQSQRRRQGRLRADADRQFQGRADLAVELEPRHPGDVEAEGRGADLRDLGDVEGLHQAGRQGERLGVGAARHAQIDLRQSRLSEGGAVRGLRPQGDRRRQSERTDGSSRGPITGAQFVAIPEFQGIGTQVGQTIAGDADRPDARSIRRSRPRRRRPSGRCARPATRRSSRAAMSADIDARRQAPLRSRGAAVARLGTLLLLPSVVVLLAWMIVPLVMTLWFSFQYYNLLDPTTTGFAGIDNYEYLVTDPDFWVSLQNTLVLLASVLVDHGRPRHPAGRAVQPAVSWPQHRPGAGDLAVLRHADGQRADLEEPADAPDLRRVRRGGARRRAAAGGLVRRVPAGVGHRHRLVGMAAVRAADPADRGAVAGPRAAGGGAHGRRRRRWRSSSSSRCRICRARSAWW